MAFDRVTCPACGRRVALTPKRRLWTHGRPECPQSRRRLSHIWPDRHKGRKVRTTPGPDSWDPTNLKGAA